MSAPVLTVAEESAVVDEAKVPNPLPLPSRRVPHWRFILDQALITPEVLGWKYAGSGTTQDPYIVTWIDSDPRNPLLMSLGRKAGISAIVATVTLAAAFMSSSYSGCIPQIIEDFDISEEVAFLGISLYVLGFALGPGVWAPLGELYGRQIILFITYGLFTACNAGAAGVNSIAGLLVLRFLAGAFAASSLTNSGGVIADMYSAEQRGIAIGLYAAAPFMGPSFGPVVGGFLGQAEGWRWVQGLTAIFSGVLWIVAAVFVPETYGPRILRKRAQKLSTLTGGIYLSIVDAKSDKRLSATQEIKVALTRPWLLLVFEPSVLLLSIYMSVLYGILYLLFDAMPIVYQEGRGWTQGQGGLAFMGIAIGEIMGCLYCIPDNLRYTRRARASSTPLQPEDRLIPAMVGAIATPIGLFWFAWTNGPSVHYLVSIAAGIPFGFGIVLLFISIKGYLVDAYTVYSATALAATVMTRSFCGAAFPMFTDYMYRNLGIHWASSVPAFLSLLCTPIPFALYKWGQTIRQRCRYAKEAEAIAHMTATGKH